MTWRSHRTVTGVLAFACGAPPLWIAVLAVCSVLPDAIEGPFRLRHRGMSHEAAVWLVLLLAFLKLPVYCMPAGLFELVRGLIFGSLATFTAPPWCFRLADWALTPPPLWLVPAAALLHLAEDMCTPGGVRIFGMKASLRLFRTWSQGEGMFVRVLFIGAVLAGGLRIAALIFF